MTCRRIAVTGLLLLILPTASGRAFVLETSARVEVVPHVEIIPGPARTGAADAGDAGLRLIAPPDRASQVVLIQDDGMGGRRRTALEGADAADVRWDQGMWSCRLTVTFE